MHKISRVPASIFVLLAIFLKQPILPGSADQKQNVAVDHKQNAPAHQTQNTPTNHRQAASGHQKQGVPTMTQTEANALLASKQLKPVKSKNEIPKLWWHALSLDSMSDRGGLFSEGCTGPFPHSRMMGGAVSDQYAALLHEQGGECYCVDFAIFTRDKDSVVCVYSEPVRPNTPRVQELCKQLAP